MVDVPWLRSITRGLFSAFTKISKLTQKIGIEVLQVLTTDIFVEIAKLCDVEPAMMQMQGYHGTIMDVQCVLKPS